MRNKLSLAAAVVLIVGSIWYLQSRKAPAAPSSEAVPIALPDTAAPEPISSSTGESPVKKTSLSLAAIAAADKRAGYRPAVEIADPTGFINTDKFALADLVGKKVILLDFWTYSCINCIRTLPHLNDWYRKYKDQGLTIVGVHTPEFEFEKVYDNVKAAVDKYGIKYPVVLDSDYGTWNAYANQHWPHHFLIDIAGYIVDHRIGEGGYEETEGKIQKLLADRAEALGLAMPEPAASVPVPEADLSGVGSPETYFGYLRNNSLANGARQSPGRQKLSEPGIILQNSLYLVGDWDFNQDYAANESAGARIIYKYRSANVYFVASSEDGGRVRILQDGQPVSAAAGKDVLNGSVQIGESRLYHLIANPGGSEQHTLELILEDPGTQAYTFTFG